MEKLIIQELKYDLDREKDTVKQTELIIVAADTLCDETQENAWDFFHKELNTALIGNKNLHDCLTELQNNLQNIKIKII